MPARQLQERQQVQQRVQQAQVLRRAQQVPEQALQGRQPARRPVQMRVRERLRLHSLESSRGCPSLGG
jgi:hypothetical protein